MVPLFYVRLVARTAGTLVYLFLRALILGHRRPRLSERLLCLPMLLFFLAWAGGLLEIDAQIQHGRPAVAVEWFCSLTVSLGVLLSLALVWHERQEYVRTAQGKRVARVLWVFVALTYLLILTRLAFPSSVLQGAPLYEWAGPAILQWKIRTGKYAY